MATSGKPEIFYEVLGHTLRLEVVKLAVGFSIKLWKVSE
jgi:hypothetical protein